MGNNPSPEQFSLMPGDSQDVTVSPGDYVVTEDEDNFIVGVGGECIAMTGTTAADGNIQAGDTQSCIFLNVEEEPEPQTCIECFTAFLTPEQIAYVLTFVSAPRHN